MRIRFLWHDVRNFVVRVYEGAVESNVPFLASALTFDALLAAIPFLLLALSLVANILSAGAGAEQLELNDYLRRFIPVRELGGHDPLEPLVRVLQRIVTRSSTVSIVAVPLFVWFSTRLFASLRTALNEIFDSEETRNWIQGKAVDVALVLVTGMLFVINTFLTNGIEVIAVVGRRFGLGFFPYLGTQLLAFGSIVALFMIIFRFVPARQLRWDTALVASLICTLFFEVAKGLLGWYFEAFVRPERIVSDATVAAALVFVGWTYYMTLVFLIGGQVAQVYELRRRQAAQRIVLADLPARAQARADEPPPAGPTMPRSPS